MDSGSSFLDRLYTSYLLRDFVAKILPGLLVLAACLYSPAHPGGFLRLSSHAPLWSWLIALGLAFITGFAVQAIGELIGWASIYPGGSSRDKAVRRAAITRMVHLSDSRNTWVMQQRERYVVLKEMAANASFAVVLSLALVAARYISPVWGIAARAAFLLLTVGAFYWFNRVQADDQRVLEELAAADSPTRTRRKAR